jgi:hypothetical protein
VPAGERVTCPPGSGANTACVHISGGGVTEVTFTNQVVPTGVLSICKIAGSGIAFGTLFTFDVSPAPIEGTSTIVVPADSCSIVTYPASSVVEITERVPAFARLVPPVTVAPEGELRTCATPLPERICVHISSGLVTEVYFTDAAAGALLSLGNGTTFQALVRRGPALGPLRLRAG